MNVPSRDRSESFAFDPSAVSIETASAIFLFSLPGGKAWFVGSYSHIVDQSSRRLDEGQLLVPRFVRSRRVKVAQWHLSPSF